MIVAVVSILFWFYKLKKPEVVLGAGTLSMIVEVST
jgi:hypothetical protein